MTTRDDLLASVEAARQEIIELCQALVRIPTVSTGIMPTGDELPAAKLLRDKLAAAYSSAGQGAVGGFWAVLEGLIPEAERKRVSALGR